MDGKILALIAPGNLKHISHFMYALDESASDDYDLSIGVISNDTDGDWIAVYGTSKATNKSATP